MNATTTTLPEIRLRVSYSSIGVNAEMMTPSSEPANEPTATAGLDTSPVSHTKKKTKKHNRSYQYDELRINNAMAGICRVG